MKHLKTYEENTQYPEVGDYVLIDPMCAQENLESFFKTEIGKIIEYVDDDYEQYHIKFDKPLPSLEKYKDNFLTFSDEEILDFSKNKEELLIKINAQNFNI